MSNNFKTVNSISLNILLKENNNDEIKKIEEVITECYNKQVYKDLECQTMAYMLFDISECLYSEVKEYEYEVSVEENNIYFVLRLTSGQQYFFKINTKEIAKSFAVGFKDIKTVKDFLEKYTTFIFTYEFCKISMNIDYKTTLESNLLDEVFNVPLNFDKEDLNNFIKVFSLSKEIIKEYYSLSLKGNLLKDIEHVKDISKNILMKKYNDVDLVNLKLYEPLENKAHLNFILYSLFTNFDFYKNDINEFLKDISLKSLESFSLLELQRELEKAIKRYEPDFQYEPLSIEDCLYKGFYVDVIKKYYNYLNKELESSSFNKESSLLTELQELEIQNVFNRAFLIFIENGTSKAVFGKFYEEAFLKLLSKLKLDISDVDKNIIDTMWFILYNFTKSLNLNQFEHGLIVELKNRITSTDFSLTVKSVISIADIINNLFNYAQDENER